MPRFRVLAGVAAIVAAGLAWGTSAALAGHLHPPSHAVRAWLPDHSPPYTCQELYDMTWTGEDSHQYYLARALLYSDARRWDGAWVYFYQRVRPMIEASCQEANPYIAPPQEPVIPDMGLP